MLNFLQLKLKNNNKSEGNIKIVMMTNIIINNEYNNKNDYEKGGDNKNNYDESEIMKEISTLKKK